jgi:hypothetical protein
MTFADLIRTRWLPLLLASLSAFAAADAGAGNELTAKPGKYGKVLVADVVLAPSQIDQMAAFIQTLAATRHGTPNSVMDGESWDWTGDPVAATPAASPYTLVVQVTGRAKVAGDVLTTWKSGWRMENGVTRVALLPGLSRFGVKLGESVTLTAPTAPVRLDGDKTLVPVLSLVDTGNFTIDGVRVQLWSGLASASWLEYLFAARFLLLGVVMLGVVLVFRRI